MLVLTLAARLLLSTFGECNKHVFKTLDPSTIMAKECHSPLLDIYKSTYTSISTCNCGNLEPVARLNKQKLKKAPNKIASSLDFEDLKRGYHKPKNVKLKQKTGKGLDEYYKHVFFYFPKWVKRLSRGNNSKK